MALAPAVHKLGCTLESPGSFLKTVMPRPHHQMIKMLMPRPYFRRFRFHCLEAEPGHQLPEG